MKNLTKSEAIANHRKMWRWIAEETIQRKRKVEEWEYFKYFEISEIPRNRCYCCEYSYVNDGCLYCPIEWGGKQSTCFNKGLLGNKKGLYAKWQCAHNYKTAAKLAAQIAELPERKTVECIM